MLQLIAGRKTMPGNDHGPAADNLRQGRTASVWRSSQPQNYWEFENEHAENALTCLH